MSRSLPIDIDAPGNFGRSFFLPVAWSLHSEFKIEIVRRSRPSRADWSTEDEILSMARQAAAQTFRNFTAEAQ